MPSSSSPLVAALDASAALRGPTYLRQPLGCIPDRCHNTTMKERAEKEDHRLTRLTKICLAMPKTTRQLMGRHAGFHVRKKTFAYFLDDHHGDGIVGINCKVLPGDNNALIASNPAKFYMPAYIGSRGWVGLRLDLGTVDWQEVEELVTHSYLLVAPTRLASAVRRRNA